MMGPILEMMNWLVPLEHAGRDCLKTVSEYLSGQVGGRVKKSDDTHMEKNRILTQERRRVEKCFRVNE